MDRINGPEGRRLCAEPLRAQRHPAPMADAISSGAKSPSGPIITAVTGIPVR